MPPKVEVKPLVSLSPPGAGVSVSAAGKKTRGEVSVFTLKKGPAFFSGSLNRDVSPNVTLGGGGSASTQGYRAANVSIDIKF